MGTVLVSIAAFAACADGSFTESENDATSDSSELIDVTDGTEPDLRDAEFDRFDVIEIPDTIDTRDGEQWSVDATETGPLKPDAVAPTPRGSDEQDVDVYFNELVVPGISDHLIAFAEGDFGFGYSVGGGLLDFDGDNDTDVFLGSNGAASGTPACLYENLAEQGESEFRCRHPFNVGRKLTGAWAFDVEGDGADEMILLGLNWATIERFYPQRERIDLLSLVEIDAECTAAAVSVMDYNLDGVADLLLGCRTDSGDGVVDNPRRNHLFVGVGEGEYQWVDPTISEPPEAFLGGLLLPATNTLALAQTDVNGDGLLDIHVINDTFSSPDSRRTTANSGGVFLSCRPDEACRYRRVTYGEGVTSWGSFMGVAMPWVTNLGFAYFLADWGPNRLLAWNDGVFEPHARERNLEISGDREQFSFTWGAITADFDFDGDDDLFISQGSMLLGVPSRKGAGERAFRDQRDVLMVQDEMGTFQEYGSSVGIPIPEFEEGTGVENPRGSRSSAFVDFDLDGHGEVFLLPYLGFTKILAERPLDNHQRCTLIPRSRYIPVSGEGYMIRSDPAGEFRSRQLQGHMQLGRPNAILVEGVSGALKFPSGAVVPWSCSAETNIAIVEEPDWLGSSYVDGVLRLTLSGDVWPEVTDLSVFVRGPAEQLASEREMSAGDGLGEFVLPAVTPGSQFMLKIDGQIVGRWFELSTSED